jgi:Protein of unknown function (DUF1153)
MLIDDYNLLKFDHYHCRSLVTPRPVMGRIPSEPVRMGPDGVPLTPSDLHPADTKRWVIRRKAVVAAAVEAGLLSPEDACRRYSLSPDELAAWQQALKEFGPTGLRTTNTWPQRKTQRSPK